MEAAKRLLRSPITTIVLFVLAAALLLVSTIGGARAALTYYSDNYTSRVQMYDIGVTLVENGQDISWRNYDSKADGTWDIQESNLLSGMLENQSLQLGRAYSEALAVKNSGSIDEFVRVTIYRYWLDGEGRKILDRDPELIELHYINLGTDWIIDTEASTPERTVLYYNKALSSGATTPPLSDTLSISAAVAGMVTQTTRTENGYTYITTSYDYDGARYQIEAVADAVQTHNAEDAIWSAWGRRADYSNGILSLR